VLSECVAYHARARPAKTACLDVATGTRTSYAALDLRSSRLAATLTRLAGPGATRGAVSGAGPQFGPSNWGREEAFWQVTRCPDATFNPDKSTAHQLVILLFTSGTTGRPKGVMVTAANACATARNYNMSAHVDSRSVFLCDIPMFHVVGLQLHVVDALPKTSLGKVRKDALRTR